MFEDLVVDARPAICWLDAFPWLEGAANDFGFQDVSFQDDSSEAGWWHQPITASASGVRRKRLAQISSLAMERLARWTIGQIFPGLPPDTLLSHLDVTTRAENTLARFGYRVAADLQNEELADLMSLPQVGVGTVDSILQALAGAASSSASPVLLPAPQDWGRQSSSQEVDDQRTLSLWAQSFADDLQLIASWYIAVGTPAHLLLGAPIPWGTPVEVVKARQRLERIAASDVLDQDQAELNAAELLQRAIGELDVRAREILARRFFADEPDTLDQLGRDMGVTRERVRQIEAKARANMVDFLTPGSPLEMVTAAARDIIGTVRPLDDLLKYLPALSKIVDAVRQPAWRVLDRLDDAYEIEDDWCTVPSMIGAQTATQARLQELADQYGVVRLDEIDLIGDNPADESAQHVLCDWLRYCGYVRDGDFIFTRTQSVGDRAASVLSITGSPMSSQEILDRLAVDRSLGSLKNALAIDDRFKRVDRDRWSLAEWGLESYAGVRALVREEVARCGGQIPIDTLIEHITGKYSVTASSVLAYASAPPFEAKGGIVRLALVDRDVRKTPERTRRLYRRGDTWLYRVQITKDHLRGSGSVAPMAIAGILDVQYGQNKLLTSDLGPQSINWTGNQPAFGTIRRFLVDDDIAIDDEIFLVIGDDGTFRIELVAAPTGNPLIDALSLIGAHADAHATQNPRVTLAVAIGLPSESPPVSIIGGYRERGDSDVSDLLLAARRELEGIAIERSVVSAEINDILDLL